VSHLISVQLDALRVLLDDLVALGAELQDELDETGAGRASPGAALPGPVGEAAGTAVAGWAEVLTALAARTLAVAATLDAALAAYRAADEGLGDQLSRSWVAGVAVPQ
jgi:hypothetical protein